MIEAILEYQNEDGHIVVPPVELGDPYGSLAVQSLLLLGLLANSGLVPSFVPVI